MCRDSNVRIVAGLADFPPCAQPVTPAGFARRVALPLAKLVVHQSGGIGWDLRLRSRRPGSPNGASLLTSMASDVGKTRPNNEDFACTFVVVRGGHVYSILAVADGVGGGPAGEFASEAAVRAVAETLSDGGWSDPTSGLAMALLRPTTECARSRAMDRRPRRWSWRQSTNGLAPQRSPTWVTLVRIW